jgi:hypothetical protein
MRRIATVIAAVVVLLAVVSQLVLPPLAERSARNRLTRDGGSAEVSVSAFPALRLLFGHGDSLRIEGERLRLPTEGTGDLGKLDKFAEVHIHLRDVTAGPLAVRSMQLDRADGAEAYTARLSGRTTSGELGAFLGSRAGGVFGGVIGGLAGGNAPLPLELRASVTSTGVEAASGTVAGVPAGPVIQLVLDAVLQTL